MHVLEAETRAHQQAADLQQEEPDADLHVVAFCCHYCAYAAADMIQTPDGDQAMPAVHTLAVAHLQPDGPTLHILDRTQRALANERWELVRLLNTTAEPEWSQQA